MSSLVNLFDEISQCYDKMNNKISLYSHYVVKFLAIRDLGIKPKTSILDICCGTGDFTKIITKFYPKSRIIGLDFSREMLKIAKTKNPKGAFIMADAAELPFKSGEFNYVTMGFGLRNMPDRKKSLSEIRRVLGHGGRFLHLDFGYHNFFSKIFDVLVLVFAKLNKEGFESYKYLIESKKNFPQPDELIKEVEKMGFQCIKARNFMFGVISEQIFVKL